MKDRGRRSKIQQSRKKQHQPGAHRAHAHRTLLLIGRKEQELTYALEVTIFIWFITYTPVK